MAWAKVGSIKGPQGEPGEDALMPEGGTPGQVLTKTEDGGEWADAPQPDLSQYVETSTLSAVLANNFKSGEGIEVGSESTGGLPKVRITNTAPMPSVVPVSKGGTGVTTEDAAAQMVFSHAPEAGPTQAGVVKTLSDEDFCAYMGMEYDPADWS